MKELSLRIVALWGKSQRRARHELASSIASMLKRYGDTALSGEGSFESGMLLLKRCIALIRKEQLKFQLPEMGSTHNMPAAGAGGKSKLDQTNHGSAVQSVHHVDSVGIKDALSVVEALLKLPRAGPNFARELVDTQEMVYDLFKIGPTIALLACRVFCTVYEHTSFMDIFKSPSQLILFTKSIENIKGPKACTAIEACIEVLIDQGNPMGVGVRSIDNSSVINGTQILASASKKSFCKLLFHPISNVRISAAAVFVRTGKNLPVEQQPTKSEIINSGLHLLKYNQFDRACISSGFEVLKWVLATHENNACGERERDTNNTEAVQIRNGLLGLLSNAPVPNGRQIFESRDYEEDVLTSSQAAALRLLIYMAKSKGNSSLLDQKVIVRDVLGSLINQEQFAVQVEALQLLRCFLAANNTFGVCCSFLKLICGERLFRKINHIHNFLLHAENSVANSKSTNFRDLDGGKEKNEQAPLLEAASSFGQPRQPSTDMKHGHLRGKRNWTRAWKTATTNATTDEGSRIISEEAAIRAFLTNDLTLGAVKSLQMGLKKLGWMSKGLDDTISTVDSTTSSLIISNKLRGMILARRQKKARQSVNEYSHRPGHTSLEGKTLESGCASVARYHDEGVIHFPYKIKKSAKLNSLKKNFERSSVLSPRAMTKESINSPLGETSAKGLASRLKLASFSLKKKEKSLSGMAAALSAVVNQEDSDWNFATLLAKNTPPSPPPSAHLRYKPMAFASFVGHQNIRETIFNTNTWSNKSSKVDVRHPEKSNEVLSKGATDKHSFLQCCNNRDYVSFQSKMAKGANRVMSIETDDAARMAEDLLNEIDISETRERENSQHVAARLGRGVATRSREGKEEEHAKGTSGYYSQRIDKAMELLATRNQRHKRPVRIQIVTTDLERMTAAEHSKKKNAWNDISGHDLHENPEAKAMLWGWCCGYNLDEMEKLRVRNE